MGCGAYAEDLQALWIRVGQLPSPMGWAGRAAGLWPWRRQPNSRSYGMGSASKNLKIEEFLQEHAEETEELCAFHPQLFQRSERSSQ